MQREVELHDIDHRFADEAQQWLRRVLLDQMAQGHGVDTASLRNARDLVERRSNADIRVQRFQSRPEQSCSGTARGGADQSP